MQKQSLIFCIAAAFFFLEKKITKIMSNKPLCMHAEIGKMFQKIFPRTSTFINKNYSSVNKRGLFLVLYKLPSEISTEVDDACLVLNQSYRPLPVTLKLLFHGLRLFIGSVLFLTNTTHYHHLFTFIQNIQCSCYKIEDAVLMESE